MRDQGTRARIAQLALRVDFTSRPRATSPRSLVWVEARRPMWWTMEMVAREANQDRKSQWRSSKPVWLGIKQARVVQLTILKVGLRVIVPTIIKKGQDQAFWARKRYWDKIQHQICRWDRPKSCCRRSQVHQGLLGQSLTTKLLQRIACKGLARRKCSRWRWQTKLKEERIIRAGTPPMPAVPTMQHTLRKTHVLRQVQAKSTILIENRRFQGRALTVRSRILLSSEVVKPNKFWKTTLCQVPISSQRLVVPTTPIYRVSILSRSLQGADMRLDVHHPAKGWQEASHWARARAPQWDQELAWVLDMQRRRSWRARVRLRATQGRHSIVRGWRISRLLITLSGKGARMLNWIKS